MRPFSNKLVGLRNRIVSINWKYLLISLMTAVLLWYTLNAREKIERLVEVRLDYKGLPYGLIVTSGQINKLSVRLRGPQELLRSMSSRDVNYTMDLSGLTAGSNIIPLNWEPGNALRAVEVVEVIPPHLNLMVDELMTAQVPVVASLRPGELDPSLKMEDVSVDPPTVTVRGPASVVSELHQVAAQVPATIREEGRVVEERVAVYSPEPALEIVPVSVQVRRKLVVSRRSLNLQRAIIVYDDTGDFILDPVRVTLVVSVPASMAEDANYLSDFQAYVRPDPGGESESKALVPVRVNTPEGGRVIKILPDLVTLRHEAESDPDHNAAPEE